MTDTSATSIAAPVSRDVVRVTGPEAIQYLQGQISQDIDALAVATSTWTFVLHPTGKVHSWARITKSGADTFLLDVDGGYGDALADRLKMFLLRTDAIIEPIDWPCVAVRGVDPPRGSLPEDVFRLPLAPDTVSGYDLLGPGAATPDGVVDASPDDIHAYRVVNGLPAMGAELTDDTIPAEVGQWIIDSSVSFTKGCFVGQELVARIDSRGGNVPRSLRAILADGPVEVGDEVKASGPAGPVTSVATTPAHGVVALAYCGRKIEIGERVAVGGTEGVVHSLPLDIDPSGSAQQ